MAVPGATYEQLLSVAMMSLALRVQDVHAGDCHHNL